MQNKTIFATLLALASFYSGPIVTAQPTFDSGSDGSDGAFGAAEIAQLPVDPLDPSAKLFVPSAVSPALDADGDNVYHFTTITIPTGTTINMRTSALPEGKPVHFLAQGSVTIEGGAVLALNGQDGHSTAESAYEAIAGAGGFHGGNGARAGNPRKGGRGPGGARYGSEAGNSAAHVSGPAAGDTGPPSETYGSQLLLPLIGGSGGAGGSSLTASPGGGGGGGALLLASSATITVDGTIQANGGSGFVGGAGPIRSGGGSGGAIRVMATTLMGSGAIEAKGGSGSANSASGGRVRLEALAQLFPLANVDVVTSPLWPGSVSSTTVIGPVFMPAAAPEVNIASIDGIVVSSDPSGVLDGLATINSNMPVSIALTSTGVPQGTIIKLYLNPDGTDPIVVDSTPVALDGTATAIATFPFQFTRLIAYAKWTP